MALPQQDAGPQAYQSLAATRLPRFRFGKTNQEQIVLAITIALLIVFGLTLNGFATVSNLLNLLRSISILGILGLGMGLIVISRGIDLSEVAIMAGSWSIALIEMQQGMSVPAAVLVALVLAIAIGVINGVMVAFVEAPALFEQCQGIGSGGHGGGVVFAQDAAQGLADEGFVIHHQHRGPPDRRRGRRRRCGFGL